MRSSSTINPPRAVFITIAPGGQKSDGLGIEEVMRLFRLGSVQAQKLTQTEKFQWNGIEHCISGLFLWQLMKVGVVDLHAKGAGTLRDCLANSSHTQDAEYFTGRLPAQECATAG